MKKNARNYSAERPVTANKKGFNHPTGGFLIFFAVQQLSYFHPAYKMDPTLHVQTTRRHHQSEETSS